MEAELLKKVIEQYELRRVGQEKSIKLQADIIELLNDVAQKLIEILCELDLNEDQKKTLVNIQIKLELLR